MSNKLSEILHDNSGGLSSLRLTMMMWAIGVLIVWVYISISTKVLSPIPESVIIMVLGVTASKTIQRFGEKEESETEVKPENKL